MNVSQAGIGSLRQNRTNKRTIRNYELEHHRNDDELKIKRFWPGLVEFTVDFGSGQGMSLVLGLVLEPFRFMSKERMKN